MLVPTTRPVANRNAWRSLFFTGGHSFAAAVVFLCIGIQSVPSVSAADPSTLATVQEKLTAWRATFANLQMAFQYSTPRYHTDEHPGVSEQDLMARYFIRGEWTWSDIGAIRFETRLRRGDEIAKSLTGVSGPKATAYRAEYRRDAVPGELESIWLYRTISPLPRSTSMITPLYRIWCPSGKWIDEVIRDEEVTLLPAADGTGAVSYIGIAVGDHKLWLDPSHDYLPAKVEWVGNKNTGAGWNWEAKEFSRFGTDTWFPRLGTSQFSSEPDATTYWEVLELRINQPLNNRIFDPPSVPVGAKVFDTRTGDVYIAGTQGVRDVKAQTKPIPAVGQLPANADRISATPGNTLFSTPVLKLLAVGAALLLSLFFLRRNFAS